MSNFIEFKVAVQKQMKETWDFYVHKDGKKFGFNEFTLIDIYKKDPCKGEFLKLMVEMKMKGCWNFNWNIDSEAEFTRFNTLMNNIPWLIENGFGGEIVESTPLVPGMILESNSKIWCWVVLPDNRLMALKNPIAKKGYIHSDGCFMTLEEMNRKLCSVYSIQE